ncbi:MAG: F0F1 ATP synthase subunit beta [bacterium]
MTEAIQVQKKPPRKGKVIGVQGPIVDILFGSTEDMPDLNEVVRARTFDKKEVKLLAAEHLEGNIARCVALSSTQNLQRNSTAIADGDALTIPVGKELFGRIINCMGDPIDGLGPITTTQRASIHKDVSAVHVDVDKAGSKMELFETGIKIIDLLFPVMKGTKTGMLGGAACGKTVIILELINNVVSKHNGACVFGGIGERIREGNELFNDFQDHGILGKIMMAFGQMDEPPGARFNVILTAITLAEWLQAQNTEVLLFLDNVYRFVQAGAEISTLLGRVPSETGYQPTLSSEVGDVHERIKGSVSAFEAVYVPADDLTDPAVVTIFSYLDSVLVLSRDMVQLGLYPAIDPLTSSCSNMNAAIVGQRHFGVAQEVIRILTKYDELRRIVAVIGLDELSKADRILYERAKKLQNFLTQPFCVAEAYTGKKGQYVTVEESIAGAEAIIDGRMDSRPDEDFYMIGKLE